jgi:hypothetical protein
MHPEGHQVMVEGVCHSMHLFKSEHFFLTSLSCVHRSAFLFCLTNLPMLKMTRVYIVNKDWTASTSWLLQVACIEKWAIYIEVYTCPVWKTCSSYKDDLSELFTLWFFSIAPLIFSWSKFLKQNRCLPLYMGQLSIRDKETGRFHLQFCHCLSVENGELMWGFGLSKLPALSSP